jgi:hypothetical protein
VRKALQRFLKRSINLTGKALHLQSAAEDHLKKAFTKLNNKELQNN